MSRDLDRERRFLAAAGPDHWHHRVVARMDAYGAAHGDGFSWCGIPRLLDELAEEALDLGGWASLVDQVLAQAPEHVRAPLATLMLRVAQLGAESHALVAEARRLVTPAQAGAET